MRILIVEDDTVIAKAVAEKLTKHDYETQIIEDFTQVMAEFNQFNPHLVLLDVNLPFYNGYYWCSQIRSVSNVPIIFISSLTDKLDQMLALQMGGDDYITKPIDFQITIAKIQALLRRTYDFVKPGVSTLNFAHVELDPLKSLLTYKNELVSLTHTELQIMQCLFEHRGTFAKRETILDYCWQNNQFIDDNTLAVNISRLRKKLKSIGLTDFIETKKKVGYRLADGDQT